MMYEITTWHSLELFVGLPAWCAAYLLYPYIHVFLYSAELHSDPCSLWHMTTTHHLLYGHHDPIGTPFSVVCPSSILCTFPNPAQYLSTSSLGSPSPHIQHRRDLVRLCELEQTPLNYRLVEHTKRSSLIELTRNIAWSLPKVKDAFSDALLSSIANSRSKAREQKSATESKH